MKRLRLLACAVAVIAGAVVGCGYRKAGEGATASDTRFDENRELFAAIGKAEELTLYEGMPHQLFEARMHAEELRNKETVTLHGFPFYRTPLDIPTDEKEKLKSLLGNEGSFEQWRGEKRCGGFHPDYCAEWHAGSAVYRVLICLGCDEVAVHGPDKNLRCDIRSEPRTQLKGLLKKHQKNRPPWEVR